MDDLDCISNFPILVTSFISLSPFHQIWLNAQWLSSDLLSKVHRSSIYKPFCRLDRLGKKNLNSSNPPDKSLADFAGAGPEKASNLLVVSFKILLYLSSYCCFLSLSVVSSANVIRSDQGERSYVNWNIYRISEKSAGGWQPNSAHVVPSSSPEIRIYSRVGPHLGLWNGKGTKWTKWSKKNSVFIHTLVWFVVQHVWTMSIMWCDQLDAPSLGSFILRPGKSSWPARKHRENGRTEVKSNEM